VGHWDTGTKEFFWWQSALVDHAGGVFGADCEVSFVGEYPPTDLIFLMAAIIGGVNENAAKCQRVKGSAKHGSQTQGGTSDQGSGETRSHVRIDGMCGPTFAQHTEGRR